MVGGRRSHRAGSPDPWPARTGRYLALRFQVGWPIFFALAFISVFALTGQEGKLFRPLAFTKTFSMAGATLLGHAGPGAV